MGVAKMSVSKISNLGTPYTIGDINYHSYPNNTSTYWYTTPPTPLVLKDFYELVKDKTTTPIYMRISENIYNDAINGDAETLNHLQDDGVWFAGDALQGGLVFFNNDRANTIGYVLCRGIEDTNDNWINWFYFGNQYIDLELEAQTSKGTFTFDNYLMFLDRIYYDGVIQPAYYWGLIERSFAMQNYDIKSGYNTFFGNPLDVMGSVTSYTGDFGLIYQANPTGTWLLNANQTIFSNSDPTNVHYRYEWWKNGEDISKDPVGGGGYSTTGGGDGSYDNSSESIPIPTLPDDLLLESGIISIYRPTPTQMNNFSKFIYSAPDAIITNFKKIWANPMDSIISFATIPFIPPVKDELEDIKFCGVKTEVQMFPVVSQYYQRDCGTLHVDTYWDSALDFNSYTKVKLYLPYYGFIDLNPDDAMGADVTVKYNIDLLTGDAIAFVYVDKTLSKFEIDYDATLYTVKCNIMCQAPLTGNNYQALYGSILNSVQALAMPNALGAVAGIGKEILSQKVNVQRSSTVSANTGELGEYKPYIVIERPVQSLPENFNTYHGYPSNTLQLLSNCSGYTEIDVDSFRTKSLNASDEEKKLLLEELDNGFIL